MPWILHNDGSFDAVTPYGRLCNAWPGIDHSPIRATAVAVARHAGGGSICYTLGDGARINLQLTGTAAGLEMSCTLTGRAEAPAWLHPLCDARIEGFDRVFRQGQGFSGPTGFAPIERETHRGGASWAASTRDAWILDSHLLVGLAGAGGLLVAGPVDHRTWMFKADLHNRCIRGSFRNREVHENLPLIEWGFRCERVSLPSCELRAPTIRIGWGSDAFATLRAHAGAIAEAYGNKPVQSPTYHYCSWYHKVFWFSHADVREVCAGLAATDPQRHVATVQIDDGYTTSHGDWLTCRADLWPEGLAPAFADIAATGRRPGIWVAPYMVGSSSRLAQDHPDWLLRWADGTQVVEWKNYDGTKRDFEHYVLDTSHPDAFAWIRTVFRTLYAHGARFFKTDFLEWGFKDSTAVRRHTPGRTSMQYVREMMEAIREDIHDSHWLGCITYYAPMLGLVDGMRVGSDVGLQWNGPGGTGNDGTGGGTQNMIEEMAGTQYFNRVWWENDPDVVYLRTEHVHYPDGEWQAVACWHGIMGGSVNTSDEIHRYSAERRAWWDFLRPGTDGIASLPYFATGHRFRVAVRQYAHGWGVLLLNDRETDGWSRCALTDLVGLPRASCFAWGPTGAVSLGELTEITAELPKHRHHLVYVSADGTPPPIDLTLGGARNLNLRKESC